MTMTLSGNGERQKIGTVPAGVIGNSPVNLEPQTIQRLRAAIRTDRLVQTAVALVEIPSPTRSARNVADCLAEILRGEGFEVQRPEAGWPESPAVVVHYSTGRVGRTLQFDGHLDTVHLRS
jgi:acetylornithine deacetylase